MAGPCSAGCPHFGGRGCDAGAVGGASTGLLRRMPSFIIAFSYIFKSKTFKISLSSFKLDFKVFNNVVKLGISTFITQMAIVVISLVCNLMLVKYGASSKYEIGRAHV